MVTATNSECQSGIPQQHGRSIRPRSRPQPGAGPAPPACPSGERHEVSARRQATLAPATIRAMVSRDPVRIREMFGAIAPRYDRANRILSLSRDVGWRRLAVRELLPRPGRVLDLASGTGDLTVTLTRQGGHRVVSADFTIEMLVAGRRKLSGISPRVGADALALPFRGESFDGLTVAFGVRNFLDVAAALREAHRVLRPGGVAGILELSTPRGFLRKAYRFYFNSVLPHLGGLITGRPSAYRYLPQSVADFPEGDAFMSLMRDAGFETVTARRLSGGIATFYRGVRR